MIGSSEDLTSHISAATPTGGPDPPRDDMTSDSCEYIVIRGESWEAYALSVEAMKKAADAIDQLAAELKALDESKDFVESEREQQRASMEGLRRRILRRCRPAPILRRCLRPRARAPPVVV